MKKIRAWKCDHCPRCFEKKTSTAKHERTCINNPSRRNCVTCENGIEVKDFEILTGSDKTLLKYTGRLCKIHKLPIRERPYLIFCDAIIEKNGVRYPIPGTCHHYKYKGYAGWEAEDQS